MEDEQDSGARGAELLKLIISLSERAGNIARRIRKDDHLIKLLTQQKGSDEANPRFVQDFKTLADVLIQETVRHYIGLKFPELTPHIKGEESAKFSNIHGETVTVEVKETQEETAKMLCKVLDGDEAAAEKLAEEVHQEVHLDDVNFGSVPLPCHLVLPIKDLGVWIDPIDSTAEYIAGDPAGGPPVNPESMVKSGLHCVTVLIGAYDRNSGIPLMGVINQPFYLKDQHGYMGRVCWGVKWGNTRAFSSPICDCASRSTIVAISGSESPEVKASLEEAGYRLCQAAGAGYKLLCVILGIAQAYILTRDSTYKWDTCAPHAILRAQGGDILIRKSLGDTNDGVTYSTPDFDEGVPDLMAQYCNRGGIIAYRSSSTLNNIISALTPG
ncbi:hypothetical protein FOCC_FOCC011919 [Frankliniella occidentalis]|uniref:Inositol polyphosphate 1-phosphatase n=1 Tax=Frankliniella occidentalis TaxID=133901 RepID=A0A6J1SLK4_FRAOC|nr:inositol polyphosphate 1-phosphatase [Frankliniella occidentalis]KAE8742509.1 hypothetical protein FOCC_FOCC011919 [Frankliniella occidentalis]